MAFEPAARGLAQLYRLQAQGASQCSASSRKPWEAGGRGRREACWLRCSRWPTQRHTTEHKPLARIQDATPGRYCCRGCSCSEPAQPQGHKSQGPQGTVRSRESSAHTVGTATGRAHTQAHRRPGSCWVYGFACTTNHASAASCRPVTGRLRRQTGCAAPPAGC